MKRDTVYKKAFNDILASIKNRSLGSRLEAETKLAADFDVSRTTVRKVVSTLQDRQIIANGPGYTILRSPTWSDYFVAAETMSASEQIEKKFMEWMLRGDRRPGDDINGLDLARQFNVSASGIRDYLNRFAHLGLIEKRPNYGWTFRGFTPEFALELFTVRELFETSSARAFAALPPTSPAWRTLEGIEREHDDLLASIESRHQDFSELDERFHRLINDASRNRFFEGFYDVISLIFHYHYQWNKVDELERNKVAISEHKAYMAALVSRDIERIEEACSAHLTSARNTLLASIA